MLRHFLAALAYRTQKALRDAPATFADFNAGSGVRTPHWLVLHMDSVLGYALTHFEGGEYWPERLPDLPMRRSSASTASWNGWRIISKRAPP